MGRMTSNCPKLSGIGDRVPTNLGWSLGVARSPSSLPPSWRLHMIHVIPENDLIEHDTSGTECPCGPDVDVENGIVVHTAMDRRECFEGERASKIPWAGRQPK